MRKCDPGSLAVILSLADRRRTAHRVPISGNEMFRQIFRTSCSGISVWRGTASTAPVTGFHHSEWARPLPLEIATMPAEVQNQASPLHVTTMVSRMASDGTPRRPSSRLS